MRNVRLRRGGAALIAMLLAVPASAQVVISEFRVRGPNGANDEFIEIYNNSGADHTVAGGGTGYAVAASDGTARCVIPNGTVIPNRGHYLCVNSVGFSLASYPAGNGTTATGDATYTTDIPDNAGIAIFNTSVAVDFTLANRLDAVGSTSEANTLYKEGTGYPALTPFSIDYSFYRDTCGKGGSITTFGACSTAGDPKDTNNNAADYIFVDTNGTSAGAGQRLGAPGPENLSAPINTGTAIVDQAPLDSCVSDFTPPNFVRDFTSDPANNSTFGTLDIRHTYTNNTGGNLTRLRFRVVDLTTFPAPSGFADLRPRTSTAVVVTVDRPPCGSGTSNVTVQGTTLEQPPSQPNGSGFNGSMSVGTVTLATPLANGATVDVRFLLGIQQTGYFKFGIVPEGLPAAGSDDVVLIAGCTDGPNTLGCLNATSIARASTNPTTAATVAYTVTFPSAVTGVNAADFALTTTGTISGASIASVTPADTMSSTTWTVTVNTGTGEGTIRLDQINSQTPPFGTATGEVYTVDRTAPTVTVEQAAGQADPTNASPVNFTVVFSEAATNFTDADVTLGGTANPTTAVVTGSGTTYNIAVSGMTAAGTVTASLAAGVATDLAGNPTSGPSTSTDNTVTYDGISPTVTIEQAAGQADPTGTSPINFTVVFSETVTDFATGDVTVGGTANPTTAVVTGSGTTYNVAVSGMTGTGTVTASLAAGVASDAVGNGNTASTSTDNSVTFDGTPPTVTINQAGGQADPTGTSPINFTVVFSETVTNFATGDVTIGGTAGATTATVTGSGTTYNVAVSGMTGTGTVTASLAAGVATDAVGNPSAASTSTDNSVTFDNTAPGVTINQAAGQADPTAASPVNFTVVFTEPVTGFATGDVTLGGTAGATTATVTGSGTTYNVAVSGMTGPGTVTATIAADVADDLNGNGNTASSSTDNSVTFDNVAPTVTINQAAGQADPTTTSPVNFTVVFSEPVTTFTTGDVTLSGTAGATTATVTGSGTTYNVAVSGTTANGTVIATIAAGVAPDAAGNANAASTSTDNSVTSNAFDTDAPTVTITPAAGQQNPAPGNVINFTVTFSEPVTGFTSSDVVIGGTSGATTATVTGGPTVYNVAVTGMTTNGTVTISLAAGVVTDTAGNPNTASGAIAGIVFSGVPVIVPTLSTFGLLAMLLAMLAVGFWMHRRNDAFRA